MHTVINGKKDRPSLLAKIKNIKKDTRFILKKKKFKNLKEEMIL